MALQSRASTTVRLESLTYARFSSKLVADSVWRN